MIIAILIVSGLLVYILLIRPWHLRWGATTEEVNRILPGDDLVSRPDFKATRGITIAAPPEEIWKWIIQIGSRRAGWYSIDWMDNAGKPSSTVILPEFQHIENGMFIPFTPDQKNGMWVKEFKAPEYILWEDKKGMAGWLWYLYINDRGETRLITRLRTRYDWKSLWILYYLLYDVGDIVMMTKCMTGIRRRVENVSGE